VYIYIYKYILYMYKYIYIHVFLSITLPMLRPTEQVVRQPTAAAGRRRQRWRRRPNLHQALQVESPKNKKKRNGVKGLECRLNP